MNVDSQLLFSDAQTVTTGSENGVVSTSSVDLGVARSIGTGEDIYLVVINDAATLGAGDTCDINLITDDNPGMNSYTVIAKLGTFGANSAIGTKVVGKLPPSNSYERYIAIEYKAAGSGALETGQFTAFLAKDAQLNRNYPIGYTVG